MSASSLRVGSLLLLLLGCTVVLALALNAVLAMTPASCWTVRTAYGTADLLYLDCNLVDAEEAPCP